MTGYLTQILAGAWLTLTLALCALSLGLALGLLAALAESRSWPLARYLATGLITLIRGLPELLVIFIIYFGGTLVLSKLLGHYVNVSAFIAGTVALALLFAAYASQVFRGALGAIPHTQIESAQALGLTAAQVFRRIVLPQAWRHALPGLGNLWLVLLKDTALISLIGLPDLMGKAQVAASATHQPFVYYLLAALLYLMMTGLSQRVVFNLSYKANRHLL